MLPNLILLSIGSLYFPAFIATCSAQLAQKCYFPNGDEHYGAESCQPNDQYSSCCETTHTCLSNGLCFDTTYNHVLRVSCTDPSWNDDSCGKYCLSSPADGLADLRQCDGLDDTWVCSQIASNCTNSITNVARGFVADYRSDNNILFPSPAQSAISTITATITLAAPSLSSYATLLPSSSALLCASASPTCYTGPNTAKHDAAIGVGVGVPLAIALAVALFLLAREKRQNRQQKHTTSTWNGLGTGEDKALSQSLPLPPQEVDGHHHIYEVPGRNR